MELEAKIPDISIKAKRPPINPPFNLSKFDLIKRIDRKNAQLNLPEINKSISNVIAEGNSIMIFPEGTRSNQKDLLPFKKGAANISQSFNLPILPVVTHNAHNLMIKGKVWFKKGDIHLDVLEPVENPNDYTTEQLTELIYKKIDEVLNS